MREQIYYKTIQLFLYSCLLFVFYPSQVMAQSISVWTDTSVIAPGGSTIIHWNITGYTACTFEGSPLELSGTVIQTNDGFNNDIMGRGNTINWHELQVIAEQYGTTP